MPAILLSPTFWLLAALGVASAYGWFEHSQATRYVAERDVAVQHVIALGSQIATQNAAVEAVRKAGEQKQKDAESALKAAQAKARVSVLESERLQRLATAKPPESATPRPKECQPSPADLAVQDIRKGLQP